MIDRELFVAVDACRPGDMPDESVAANAALADGPVVELRKRIELTDRRMRAALLDVEPPAGLAERLLARLVVANPEAPPTNEAAVAPAAPRPVNRRLFVVAGLAATAAAVLIAVQMLEKPTKPWTAAEVLDAAIGRYVSQDAELPGRPMAEAPDDYPYSRDLRDFRELAQARWRPLDDPLAEADGVAYDLSLQDGARATLFVLAPQAEVVGLRENPPQDPATPTTQGVCAAAWQDGGRVYVLVVAGGAQEYRQFVKRGAGPIVIARSASDERRVALRVAMTRS